MLVRDLMTIGVPVCRNDERCGDVAARLTQQKVEAEVIVAHQLDQNESKLISEIMDEEIPTVSPTLPVEAAAQKMREKGVQHLLLMHDWPGEPRPSAVISLKKITEYVMRDA
ncbi:MAG: CBS domain-containing protein [Chloroflexi bacterium]|nr:CBS domain-containing protein [Chloroflexota bacterium]